MTVRTTKRLKTMIELEHPDNLHFNANDYSGHTYGRLTFLLPTKERTPSGGNILWLCQCSCGALTTVSSDKINGEIKSCGCLREEWLYSSNYNDISGQQFGRLTAIELAEKKDTDWHMRWKCECECGNTTIVSYGNLSAGTTRSCGCLAREITSERASKYTGSNNPNWKGGISSEFVKIRSSKEYDEWRTSVFERDKYTCINCDAHGSEAYVEAHHILPFAIHPEYRFDVDNGATLCQSCHNEFHSEYGCTCCDRVDFVEWLDAD